MISPHLLKIQESFSTSIRINKQTAEEMAKNFWNDKPTLVIPNNKKNSSWTHMVLASGPATTETSKGTELVVIWWSEFEPYTARVLSAIDWEKHAKDYT
jgi:hypothetical protein